LGSIYNSSPAGASEPLRQCELLANVTRVVLDTNVPFNSTNPAVKIERYEFAVVLSQICDLQQDFAARQHGKSVLSDILLCQTPTAEQLRGTDGLNSTIWSQVKINKHERYHFLETIPADCDLLGQGLPEMGVDFRRYFTIPAAELYSVVHDGRTQRRTILASPYLEHLSNRFSAFLGRVGLPRDHTSV
jgi:hypothetical protein